MKEPFLVLKNSVLSGEQSKVPQGTKSSKTEIQNQKYVLEI